jgi:ATP-binding cassette subfamily B protein
LDIRTHIESRLRPNETLQLVTSTDLLRDGRFGRRWVAVTSERLVTAPDAPEWNGFEAEYELGELSEVRTAHQVGRLELQVHRDGTRDTVLTCTNSLSSRFAKVAHALNATCKDGKPFELTLDDEERMHCERCGRLLPEKDGFCPSCLDKGNVLARFWQYMRPHWRKAAVVSGCIVASTMLRLTPPYLVKVLTDDVLLADDGTLRMLTFIVLALAGTHVAGAGIEILMGRTTAWLSSSVMHDVRFDFYQALQGLNLKRYDKAQTGSLLSRLTGDTQMLNFMFVRVGTEIVPSILQLVGICVMLVVLNARLALLVLLPTPLLVAATMLVFRKLRRYYHRLWQRRARMTARATDAVSGIRVVKAFSQEPREIDGFGARSEQVAHATAAAEGAWHTYFPILSLITMAGTFLVWYFGGRSVMAGAIQYGTLMAYLMYITQFYGPLQTMTRFSDFMNRAFTAAQRLFEITDSDQEEYEDPDALPMEGVRGAFDFEKVVFSYVKDRPVLKGLTVRIEPGEMVGLVGRSGVGKTTLTNLICRFYDVDEGVIRLDGEDIRRYRLRDLRRQIGIVPQESYLFHGSIAENIGYARADATRHDIIRAAIAANAHGFIMRQPDGYDTRVGERGVRLSGGEKQRIAIARALLHDPKILILDEATSSMDTETEELIQKALENLVRGRTTFAIAHRLSTLRNADRLLVIDDGKVAEFGTHEELLERKGIYHRLVEMQSRLSALKAVDG